MDFVRDPLEIQYLTPGKTWTWHKPSSDRVVHRTTPYGVTTTWKINSLDPKSRCARSSQWLLPAIQWSDTDDLYCSGRSYGHRSRMICIRTSRHKNSSTWAIHWGIRPQRVQCLCSWPATYIYNGSYMSWFSIGKIQQVEARHISHIIRKTLKTW